LYLDHVEVYDNDGWNDVIKDSKGTAEKIKRYAESFPTDYPYIKYFLLMMNHIL